MDKFNGLMPFVRTAELGSFVAAGKTLGLSPSAVGKAVARLEQQVGIRLFQRSTRTLRLTEEGRVFLERCRRILDDLDDAYATMLRSQECPRGRLRVSTPVVTYHLLLPILPKFMEMYPEIELDLDFNDHLVDLIEDGVDVAIRSGELPDSRLTARTLRPIRILLCASPAYLARHGTPAKLHDLCGHGAIRFRFPDGGRIQDWPITEDFDLRIKTIMTCNNMEAILGATVSGLGIAAMPDFLVKEPVEKGTLQVILADHVNGPAQFSLLWPSNRNLSPKVRVFVDYVGKHLFADHCELPHATEAAEALGSLKTETSRPVGIR
ncbi:LysR family transcriptional regulator [Neorhizobium sp. P12A]|uniref:LysR family transcriptional regulator n=1 Tax=Rhizobium/Agrobacterium group TaxID=227290 RepID=UPI001044B74E|nr:MULTISPECIES: LysR family transcriptional regulator [Rhizobium/Agrobacterium group]KAA0698069.1 LysR family transcriptional regulator [Neorhizobium sp. P12A]TCR87896.1 DNA-binding transcriptional LysR family regulator [Rhizobium sp. BK376]